MGSSTQLQNTIPIRTNCHVSNESLNVFQALVQELLPLASISDRRHLKEIRVVRDEDVARTVNALIKQGLHPTTGYSPDENSGHAVVVPLETEHSLNCFIVFSKTFVENVDRTFHHPYNVVSTLLEELIHVGMHSATWQRRGYIMPRTERSAQRDLLVVCSMGVDEYYAARKKVAILGSVPLAQTEDGLSVIHLAHPSLEPFLSKAGRDLREIVRDATNGILVDKDAWDYVINTMHRGVFDPLARDAGMRAGSAAPNEQPPHTARQSQFYRNHFASYWQQIKSQLERIFDSNFTEMESALDEMVVTTTTFLQHIGIRYIAEDDGTYSFSFERGRL